MKKEEKKVLHLSLKKEWFDMIDAGIKKEEYRKMNNFWTSRICTKNEEGEYICTKEKFKYVEFTLGYPKKEDTSKRMRFEIDKIYPNKGGIKEWGADLNEIYFVIRLGKRLEV